MVERFSKNTETREELSTTYYLQTESYVKIPVSACCCIPTSLPQEQAYKTNGFNI